MANKLIKRRYNNLLTARRNYFWPGGSLLGDILNIPGIQGIVGQNPLDSINLKNFGSFPGSQFKFSLLGENDSKSSDIETF